MLSNLITFLKIEFTKSKAFFPKNILWNKITHMKRIEQIVVIFIAAALAIPSYWFFWTLAGGGGYNKRTKPIIIEKKSNTTIPTSRLGP